MKIKSKIILYYKNNQEIIDYNNKLYKIIHIQFIFILGIILYY